LISTVRASLAPVPDSGLADQTMLPDVVEPMPLVDPELGVLELPLVVLVPLLPQPARASAPTTPTRAVTRQRLAELLPTYLSDRSRTIASSH
jgi:hypothetical protein